MTDTRPEWNDDIGPILAGWEFSAHGPQLRFLAGIGGVKRIQIRLEAGLLQFELTGRPDGTRPEGYESWFDYWQEQPGPLSTEGVAALLAEVALFHQRAVALMLLEDFAASLSDCARNSIALAAINQRGGAHAERLQGEPMHVALVLLRARCEASMCMRTRDTQGALAAIDRGLASLQRCNPGSSEFLAGHGTDSPASAILRGMRDALVPKLPSSQRVDLETRLRRALRLENYELAVILRNELRQIDNSPGDSFQG